MKEQESLGGCSISVLCSAVPQALARCFLPGEVNVLTQGPSDTHNRLFSECVLCQKGFDKVKRLHTHLLRKQALRTVCCVFLEGPWVLWCSAGVYITPHKRLGLRAKKPGSGLLIYTELFKLLAVLCVSILVCVQASNFIRKTKLSVVTWGCHILSAMGTTLSTTGNHIHTIARSSRQAEVSNRGWSPGDMLPLKSTLNRTHIPWFSLADSSPHRSWGSLGSIPDHQDSRSQQTLLTNAEVTFAWLEKTNS